MSGVLFGVLALSPAMPVSALDQAANAIRVTENQKVEKEFGPIAGQNPLPGLPAPAPKLQHARVVQAADVLRRDPAGGRAPADAQAVRRVLRLGQPGVEDGADPGRLGRRPRLRQGRPTSTTWTSTCGTTRSARRGCRSSSRPPPRIPEKLRLFRPSKGKYSIVVFNYLGPNTGYKLTVEYKPESIVPPFESLAPEFQPIETPPTPFEPPVEDLGPVEMPADTSGEDFTPVTQPPAPPAESAPAPLTPVVIDPDPDFTNFADDAFDEQLAAPTTDVLTEKQVKAVGPPKPASAESLLFWLALVPLLLVAAGGFWLSKKGSAVLKLR